METRQSAVGGEAPSRTASDGSGKRLSVSSVSIVLVYVLLFAVWQYFGRGVSPYVSSYPSAIADAFVRMLRNGELGGAFIDSLRVLLIGLTYTFAIGLPVGYGIGRFKTFDDLFGPIVTGLFVAPRVVFVPLLVVWFGLTDTSRIVLIVLAGVFPLIYNVADGVRSLSAAHVDVARAYGASEWQIISEVTLPAILPFIGTGAHQSIVRSMTGLVVAEFFIGIAGLGGLLQQVSADFQLDKSFAIIFVLVAIGFVLTTIGSSVEAYLGRWRQTERAYRS